jgi:hypothetical protein
MEHQNALERRFIRRNELFSVTGIKTRSWDDWHLRGFGPRRIKIGKAVLYEIRDVLGFLEKQKEGIGETEANL